MARKYRGNQITLKIEGLTPYTLPSKRLGQYLLDLDELLGSTSKVHFRKIGKGSALMVLWAEEKQIPDIRQRVKSAKAGSGKKAPELIEAFDKLNAHLVEDNSSAVLKIGREKVLDFPGMHLEERQIIGPVIQSEYLDGQLIRIGGIDATVPVHIREGADIHCCTANVLVAKQLAPYLYGPTLRIFGFAYWFRYPQGNWNLDKFKVENFQPLQDIPLKEAVERLRSIPHADWDESIGDKIKLREGG